MFWNGHCSWAGLACRCWKSIKMHLGFWCSWVVSSSCTFWMGLFGPQSSCRRHIGLFWRKVSKDLLGFSFILFFLLVILWMREGQGLCSSSILVPSVLTNWGNTSSMSCSVLVFERSYLQLHQEQQDVTCGTRREGADPVWGPGRGRCCFCRSRGKTHPGRGTGGAGELLATRSVKPLEGEIGEQSPDQWPERFPFEF